MATQKSKKNNNPQNPFQRQHNLANALRILAFLVAVMLLVAGLQEGVYPASYYGMVVVLLAYPLAAQVIGLYLRQKQRDEHQSSRVLVQTDALMMGFAIASLHFDLVPSLVLLIIIHSNALSYGGLKYWLMNIFWMVLGAALGTFIFSGGIIPPGNTAILSIFLSMLGLGIFMNASSFFLHQQSQYLRDSQLRLLRQQKQAVALSRKLARYVPPQIWGSLFAGKQDATLGTNRKRLTVFFSDIKDFSRISESLPLKVLTGMLNSYLNEMTQIAEQYGGTVDKFIGDAVMVFFGDPDSNGSEDDAYRCVAMAIAMQQRMHLLRQRWRKQGIREQMQIRIGINSGFVTVGNFGTDNRMDYTILGTDVNLASRLESAARPGHILISEQTYKLVANRVRVFSPGAIQVKGFDRPIPVHEVVALKDRTGSRKTLINANIKGCSLYLNLAEIKNYDRKRVISILATAASQLKDKQAGITSEEVHGFGILLAPSKIERKDITKVSELLRHAVEKLRQARY